MDEPVQDEVCRPKVTFWGRSSFGKNGNPPWTLQWHHGRGYCAFSTQAFQAGDQILKEHPTTWTAAWHPFTETDKARIEQEVSALEPQLRYAFYEMDNSHPDVMPRSAGIYMTNSFDMPDGSDNHASGMFLAIARLNHSCIPNAQQTYIPCNDGGLSEYGAPGYEVLYASRDIPEGSELCDCYIELRQTTEQRRKDLLQYYNFLCTCPACGPAYDADLSPEALQRRKDDDARRKRALKLETDALQYVEMGEIGAAIDLGEELVKLLEHEKSRGWGERFIADACMTTSTLLAEEGQVRKSLFYAQRAHEWNVKLQGEFSPDSVSSRNKVKQLQDQIR